MFDPKNGSSFMLEIMKIRYIKSHVSIFTVDSISTDTILVSTVDCSEFHQGRRSGQNTLLIILKVDCSEFNQGLRSGKTGR